MKKLLKLFENQKYDELLTQLANIDDSQNNYYEIVALKIKALIKSGSFEEAKVLINAELSMPYIPRGFEKTLKELEIEVISLEPKEDKVVIVSESELEEALFKSGDIDKGLNLIEKASKFNLKLYLNIFSKYLLWKEGDNNIKSIIMFTLKYGNIAGEFEVEKEGIKHKFIPLDLVNTNELSSFIVAKKIIDQSFFQEVSKQEIANYLIFTKFFALCPRQIKLEEAKNLAFDVVEEVKKSFA